MILTDILAALAFIAFAFILILIGWLVFMLFWTDKIQPKLAAGREYRLKHKNKVLAYKLKKHEVNKIIKNKFKVPLFRLRDIIKIKEK